MDSPWTPGDLARALLFVIATTLVGIALLLAAVPFVEQGSRLAVLVGLTLTGSVQVGMLASLWLFAFRRGPFKWGRLGFRPLPLSVLAVSVPTALLVTFLGLTVYGLVIQALRLNELEPPSIPSSLAQDAVTLTALATIAIVVAPVVEESFFRGFAFPALRSRWGTGGAAVLSALLFGIAHISISSIGLFIPTATLGLLLVFLYLRTGSIWPSVLVHASFNAINVAALASGSGG